MIRVFCDAQGLVLESSGVVRRPSAALAFDDLFTAADPVALALQAWEGGASALLPDDPGAPIGTLVNTVA